MKKIYFLMLALLFTAAVNAQNKIDAPSMQALASYFDGTIDPVLKKAVFKEPVSRGGAATVRVLIEVQDGNAEVLESAGYQVDYISRDFVVAEIPTSDILSVAENPEVKSMSFAKVANTLMDIARESCKVNAVHGGLGLGATKFEVRPFKGDGVIAALYDSGFDPSHINWYDKDQTKNRLQYYRRTTNGAQIYRGDEAAQAPTDNSGATHGTHVAGIMTGAYNGAGTYYGSGNSDMRSVPLYGVAPNAELAVGAGSLATADIVSGVKALADYAVQEGKPIVINLSLGSNIGPHDGTDSDVRAIDQIVEETGAIVCVAAGNEGAYNCHAAKTFSAATDKLTVLFDKDQAAEYVDVWSSTTAPITVSLIVVNSTTGEVVAKMPSVPGGTTVVGNGSTEAELLFKDNFSGRVSFRSKPELRNGRYNVFCSISTIMPTIKNKGTYNVGLMVEALAGVRTDVYGSAVSSFATSLLPGIDMPDANGSVSGMACGHKTICVGAFTTRTTWTTLSGYSYSYTSPGAVNSISKFSSWGDLIDGRRMPFITAPGMGINSSYSSAFVKAGGAGDGTLVAMARVNNKDHYWGLEQGTSMACPFVSGVVALWLEADPALTVDKIKDIMSSTAIKDNNVTEATVWGAGKVDAYNGIKEVLKQAVSGIADVAVDGDDLLISQVDGGRTVDVFSAGASKVEVQLYTVGGAMAASASADGDSVQLSAENLAPGVYIVRAGDGSRTATRKIVL